MKIVRALLMILLVVAVFVAGFGYGRWYGGTAGGAAQKGGRKILYYVDPMHPAYKSDKPGIAPDCGMKLEPVYEDGGAASPDAAERKILHYRDPQNPSYTSDKPGQSRDRQRNWNRCTGRRALPMGTIKVSPEKQQLIGVRYGEVNRGRSIPSRRWQGR
jgi:hypothetical protein